MNLKRDLSLTHKKPSGHRKNKVQYLISKGFWGISQFCFPDICISEENLKKKWTGQAVVVLAFNTNTQKVEAGRLL